MNILLKDIHKYQNEEGIPVFIADIYVNNIKTATAFNDGYGKFDYQISNFELFTLLNQYAENINFENEYDFEIIKIDNLIDQLIYGLDK